MGGKIEVKSFGGCGFWKDDSNFGLTMFPMADNTRSSSCTTTYRGPLKCDGIVEFDSCIGTDARLRMPQNLIFE